MILAILFDLDGVLCDLVHVHGASFNDALAEVTGYTISEYEFWKYYNGIPSKTKLSILINRGIVTPNELEMIWKIKQGLTTQRIRDLLKPDEQKIELHRYFQTKGYALACVSNSIRQTIDLSLSVTGQLDFMDLILSNEDFGDKPKPDSYCYTMAIEKLYIDKEEALIIEDSEKGIISARGSGAHVLEVKDATEVTIKNIESTIQEIERQA